MVLAGLGEAGAPGSQPSSGWSAVTSQDRRPDQWHCPWGRPAGSRAGCLAAHCTLSLRACSAAPEPGFLRWLWGLLCPSLSLICPPLSASSPADSWGLARAFSLQRMPHSPPLPLIHRLTAYLFTHLATSCYLRRSWHVSLSYPFMDLHMLESQASTLMVTRG